MDDNRAMRAESGVGTLPNGCCAPLAFPYVPVQKNDIRRLQEFGCNLDTYDPYRNGDPPMFREERALWF